MTMMRKTLLSTLMIATLLGTSAVAAALPGVSYSGSAAAKTGVHVDGSDAYGSAQSELADATGKLDGVVSHDLDAAASASGAVDAKTDHAGVSGAAGLAAKVSGAWDASFGKLSNWMSGLFGKVDAKADANADASASGGVKGNTDGASGNGSVMGKLGASLAGLFHL